MVDNRSVSYTHLDVYKRQVGGGGEGDGMKTGQRPPDKETLQRPCGYTLATPTHKHLLLR